MNNVLIEIFSAFLSSKLIKLIVVKILFRGQERFYFGLHNYGKQERSSF